MVLSNDDCKSVMQNGYIHSGIAHRICMRTYLYLTCELVPLSLYTKVENNMSHDNDYILVDYVENVLDLNI